MNLDTPILKIRKGRKHLSNQELISLAIGTGTEKDLETAATVLQAVSYDLNRLARLSLDELKTIKGMTCKKAAAILSVFELGLRRESTPISQRPQITQSSDAYDVLKADLKDLAHEEFIILLLNQANRVIDKISISVGGLAGTVVDVKKILRPAIDNPYTSGIILAHNHPSDNMQPSKADIDITKKIKEAGKYMDIVVMDHIIIAGNGYTSLADEGLM